jgi:hypothetical protein
MGKMKFLARGWKQKKRVPADLADGRRKKGSRRSRRWTQKKRVPADLADGRRKKGFPQISQMEAEKRVPADLADGRRKKHSISENLRDLRAINFVSAGIRGICGRIFRIFHR